MQPARLCALFVACILVGNCGYTDAGVGTRTLEVHATLQYAWETDSTMAQVWLSRAEIGVADANVLLVDADSRLHDPVAAATVAGHYTATFSGYRRRLQLSVRAGSDELGGQLEGPGEHRIATPSPGTVLPYGRDATVRWTTEDGIRADSVTVSLLDPPWSQRLTNDQGLAHLPAHALAPGMHTLTVERRSHLVPQGGAGHSHVDIAYAVSTPFVVRLAQ